ncbi:MAG: hypothetical protein JWL71_1300 [Acidobacteria bacterium]|nr:hypothetical protein [Acidobacteriota bacterium]
MSNVGLGLLRALNVRSSLVFEKGIESPRDPVRVTSKHLVVCEDDDEFAQVLAANYAFALGASMCLVPAPSKQDAEEILERLYTVSDNRTASTTTLLEGLRSELRQRAGALPLPSRGAVTFVTKNIPWGFAFPELPSTHLFSSPDLGIALVNGLVAEQRTTSGIRVAAIVDPGTVDAGEVGLALKELTRRGVVATALRGRQATVHRTTQTIEHLPYDLLLISTHCGDVSGWEWTYEFIDSEGNMRTLITEIAIGVQVIPGQDDLRVTQFTRFVALDGVDWNDPVKKKCLYVGTAMRDFIRLREQNALEPVRKKPVSRVQGSMALRMADNNYIASPQSLAAAGAPIVINNACASWHRLAGTFAFANSRAYIGALFPVLDPEAQAIIERIFGEYFGKPLAVALWRAQNDVAGKSVRRPYVMVGCHFQALRASIGDNGAYVLKELKRALANWQDRLNQSGSLSDNARRNITETVKYLEQQVASVRTQLGVADD